VTAAFDRMKGDCHTRVLQSSFQQHALMIGHESVSVAVCDKKRRSVGCDVVDRICSGCLVFVALKRPADESGLRRTGSIVPHAIRHPVRIHLKKVCGAKPVGDSLNTTGDTEILADIEEGRLTRRAEHRDQVPARRSSPRAEPVRVKLVLVCIAPQPSNRRFAVLNLRREDRILTQAIVERRKRVAIGKERLGILVALIAARKCSTMDKDDERDLRVRFWDVEIELLSNVSVGDVSEIAIRRRSCREFAGLTSAPLRGTLPSTSSARTALRKRTPASHRESKRQGHRIDCLELDQSAQCTFFSADSVPCLPRLIVVSGIRDYGILATNTLCPRHLVIVAAGVDLADGFHIDRVVVA